MLGVIYVCVILFFTKGSNKWSWGVTFKQHLIQDSTWTKLVYHLNIFRLCCLSCLNYISLNLHNWMNTAIYFSLERGIWPENLLCKKHGKALREAVQLHTLQERFQMNQVALRIKTRWRSEGLSPQQQWRIGHQCFECCDLTYCTCLRQGQPVFDFPNVNMLIFLRTSNWQLLLAPLQPLQPPQPSAVMILRWNSPKALKTLWILLREDIVLFWIYTFCTW